MPMMRTGTARSAPWWQKENISPIQVTPLHLSFQHTLSPSLCFLSFCLRDQVRDAGCGRQALPSQFLPDYKLSNTFKVIKKKLAFLFRYQAYFLLLFQALCVCARAPACLAGTYYYCLQMYMQMYACVPEVDFK